MKTYILGNTKWYVPEGKQNYLSDELNLALTEHELLEMGAVQQPDEQEKDPFNPHDFTEGNYCRKCGVWYGVRGSNDDIDCPASSAFSTDEAHSWAIDVTNRINHLTKRGGE